ncbi:MAG TPA: hypothetical protein ENF26_03040 [Methanomicrobia archaeon]|nr:hypothetical protein [Methanomicrobia archaeon]HEX59108.1 hypothetical protein [Methanomicrobia archaeon]
MGKVRGWWLGSSRCPSCGRVLKKVFYVGDGYWGERWECECGYERKRELNVQMVRRSHLKEKMVCRLFGHKWQQASPLSPRGTRWVCLTCGKEEVKVPLYL